MRILSVTEHINTLNSVIYQQAEFINNVERMRRLQLNYNNHAASDFDYHDDLRAAEKLVDESLIKLKTGGENNAAKKNQNA